VKITDKKTVPGNPILLMGREGRGPHQLPQRVSGRLPASSSSDRPSQPWVHLDSGYNGFIRISSGCGRNCAGWDYRCCLGRVTAAPGRPNPSTGDNSLERNLTPS